MSKLLLGVASAIAVLVSVTLVRAAEPVSALGPPRSLQLQHEQIVRRLEHLATTRNGAVAATARRAAAFLKAHYAKEEEFVLPPLGLLSTILSNPNPSDLDRAVAMAERTKAALKELMDDHVQITALMNELIGAGNQHNDEELVRLATRVAAQSLNDIEVNQPATILIGEFIRRNIQVGK